MDFKTCLKKYFILNDSVNKGGVRFGPPPTCYAYFPYRKTPANAEAMSWLLNERRLFRVSNFVKTTFETLSDMPECNALEHEKDKALYEESGHQTVLDNIPE